MRRDGRSTGEAYVLFGTAMQARRPRRLPRTAPSEPPFAPKLTRPQMDFALQKNRQPMGRRYIEVFRAKKTDYYAAVHAHVSDPGPYPGEASGHLLAEVDAVAAGVAALALPRPPLGGLGGPVRVEAPTHTGVVKLRGLPFAATKDDIIAFFGDPALCPGVPPLAHDSIHVVTSADGRPSGVAFVEFGTPEDAKTAMRKNRQCMGQRYLEIFPSSREEATRAATSGSSR